MKRIIMLFLVMVAMSGCKEECETTGDCALSPDPGLCQAAFPRYYFDSEAGECKEFLWGGCGGVVPFETFEDCLNCGCN